MAAVTPPSLWPSKCCKKSRLGIAVQEAGYHYHFRLWRQPLSAQDNPPVPPPDDEPPPPPPQEIIIVAATTNAKSFFMISMALLLFSIIN
ncbi:MAG: hypothetical protein MZU91_01640 [Desulfosudis oleivorans]|nr:hypothetical protein [Desulfosudis oleivorans]